MSDSRTIESLNRLLRIVHCSLPAYLHVVHPWTGRRGREVLDLLRRIAEDHGRLACRLAEAIRQRGGVPDARGFPDEFTDLHDVALDFLVRKVIERQVCELAAIECDVAELERDPELRSLAQNLMATARLHLELLRQAEVKLGVRS